MTSFSVVNAHTRTAGDPGYTNRCGGRLAACTSMRTAGATPSALATVVDRLEKPLGRGPATPLPTPARTMICRGPMACPGLGDACRGPSLSPLRPTTDDVARSDREPSDPVQQEAPITCDGPLPESGPSLVSAITGHRPPLFDDFAADCRRLRAQPLFDDSAADCKRLRHL